jgi:predicted MFS family arabinose efflux permease
VEPLLSRRAGGAEVIRLFARVFLPFVAGYYVSYAFRSVNALLGPQIAAEYGFGAADLGFLTSVYFLAFGIVQIPAGILLDRFGPGRVNSALLLVAAGGAIMFAAAQSFVEVVAGRALIGLGVSVCLMASFQAFLLWYPADRIATLNSLAFAIGILGAITVSVPLEAALRFVDWRTIMLVFAAVALASSGAIYVAVPEHRRAENPASPAETLYVVRSIVADAAFRRTAGMVSASQCAAVSLYTLWIATWLRDVAGFDRAGVGRALLVVSLALIAGYLFFGRLADALARRRIPESGLVATGVGLSSVCLLLLALGVTTGVLWLWAVFIFASSAATLGYAIVSRRFPKEMAGRVNTTFNTFVFTGMFLGQWGVGLVLERWPATATGYAADAYGWALGALWAIQLAGLGWFWRGRRLLAKR